jgi:hypothetical protein
VPTPVSLTAHQLTELCGLLANESTARAIAGDGRERSEIVDSILREVRAPHLVDAIVKIEQMIGWRRGRAYRPLADATR